MKKYILILIAAIIVLVVLFSNQDITGKQEIVIGAPLSLTGPAATDGESIKNGLELAREDLAKKGINVKIVYEDDGTDPKRAISAIQKMIAFDKPVAIVGPTWSFLGDAVAPILKQNQLPSFAPANTSEFVEENEYTFFGAIKNEKKITPVMNFLKENNKKKIGIVVDKSSWGESHVEPFRKAVIDAGGEVVLVERVPFGSEQNTYPTILAKAKSLNVDTLLVTGYEEGLTILIKRSQEQNPGLTLVIAEEVPKMLLKKGNIRLSESNPIYVTTGTHSEEFADKYKAKFGHEPRIYSDRAYDGLMLLVDGLMNKKDGETLAQYLHEKTNYKGYATTYSFDERGDIKGGEWVVERLK